MTDDLGYRPFDCDNPYHQTADAFLRHVAPQTRHRVVHWAQSAGRRGRRGGGR